MRSFYLFTFILTWLSQALSNPVYVPGASSIWHLEIQPGEDVLVADYYGNLTSKDLQTGSEHWTYSAGSFIFDMKTADLEGDGQSETLYVTADGDLVVLSPKGTPLWSFRSGKALFNVVVGDFTGDAHLEVACGGIDRLVRIFDYRGNLLAVSKEAERVVHRLAAGDLYGDSYDEILSIEARTTAHLMGIASGSLQTIWKKPLQVPEEMINWENPGGSFMPFSIIIEDLDADGKPEIVMGDTYFNKQAVMVTNHRGDPIWISDRLPAFEQVDGAQIDFYSTAFVRAADLVPEIHGKEVLSVAGGMFRIWDQRGKLIAQQNGKIAFADFEIRGRDIFLASNPNGDTTLYRISFDEDWTEAVASLEFQGKIRRIKENTETLLNQVLEYAAPPVLEPVYDLTIGFRSILTTPEGYENHRKQVDWFQDRFPYSNIRLTKSLKVMEAEPVLDENGDPWFPWRFHTDSLRGTNTVAEIIQKARWIEEHQIPTLFVVGHSCMPSITLDTAEAILQAAPNYCLGFITNEDERLEVIPRYFRHFMQGLADLCLEYGGKICATKNKGLWWITSPADPWVFEALFEEGRRTVTMASTEDSNSRTPELNLMGRGGLWQAGLLQRNEVSTHADIFSFNRFHQWENIKVGHPYLRLLVAHTTMGMTMVNTRIREVFPSGDSFEFTQIGRESSELFIHLLGKGLVRSPSREQALGYSPIGIVVHKPPPNFLADAHNGHAPELWKDEENLHWAVLPHNGNLWGMTTTPEHALTHVLFNKRVQFGYQVPPTPYGLVAFVPEHADLEDVHGVTDWWHTDGISIWKEGGAKLTGMGAAERLRQDFDAAAGQLPVRHIDPDEAVFMNIHQLDQDRIRLYLVDPGWLDPEAREVELKIQWPGRFTALNVLTNERYSIKDSSFTVPVPAGLFTIVDLQRGRER